jgi:pimeloyl-ACP methyl ester carboxylesterase
MADRTITGFGGVQLAVHEAGEGPLVLLCHGFPELARSWRHQLPALAAAGYHAVAADGRGYGESGCPDEVTMYDIEHLCGDQLAVLDAMGAESAVFVGHDWGAMVVWALAQRAPERVRGVVAMSVPFTPRPPAPPTAIFRHVFTDTWFYMLYFQAPGVADADLGRDPATTMRRFLGGISGDLDEAEAVARLARDDRGTRTGFTGPLNWYRNMDRNWELSAAFDGKGIDVPSLFIGGTHDVVLRMMSPEAAEPWLRDHRGDVLVDGAGHWVQQERPEVVNDALLRFLADLG